MITIWTFNSLSNDVVKCKILRRDVYQKLAKSRNKCACLRGISACFIFSIWGHPSLLLHVLSGQIIFWKSHILIFWHRNVCLNVFRGQNKHKCNVHLKFCYKWEYYSRTQQQKMIKLILKSIIHFLSKSGKHTIQLKRHD